MVVYNLLRFREVTRRERLPDCLSAVMRGYIVLINMALLSREYGYVIS